MYSREIPKLFPHTDFSTGPCWSIKLKIESKDFPEITKLNWLKTLLQH